MMTRPISMEISTDDREKSNTSVEIERQKTVSKRRGSDEAKTVSIEIDMSIEGRKGS